MNMIERIAKALYERWAAAFAIPKVWEEAKSTARADFLEIACTAIAAMREPTDEMVSAGENCTADPPVIVWQAMIDKALAHE